MKRILFFFLNAILGGLLFSFQPAASQTIQGFLRRSNTQIVNNQGAIELKGVNVGNWLHIEPYMIQADASATRSHSILTQQITQLTGDSTFAKQFFSQWRDTFIQEKDIEHLANLGFNHIRVPFPSHLFWNETTQSNTEEGFIYLDRIIEWGKKYDLYLILDLHEAPGGQIDGELWSNYEVNKARTVDIWRRIATRYALEPAVGGYDVLNEPLITNQAEQWKLKDLYVAITQAIRQVDTNHILFFEGNWYASSFWELTDGTASDNDRWDSNMAFSHHVYWVPLPSQTTFWVNDIATKMNIPVWCGEGGENSNHWIADWIKDCRTNQMGWCFWTYKKASSISAVVTHALSANYQQITNYWKNGGTPPSPAVARQGFLDLIQSSDLAQCTQSLDVQDALIRTNFLTQARSSRNHTIPGTIRAVDFDFGGNGVAYRDEAFQSTGQGANYTNYNQGWTYRNDGVDIETWTGSPTVGQVSDGEWLQYTLSMPTSGLYQIKLEYATTSTGRQVHFSVDGQSLQDTITLPITSGWGTWRTENAVRVPLWSRQEEYPLRVFFKTGGLNVRSIQLERLGPLNWVIAPKQNRSGNQVTLQWQTDPSPILTNFQVEYREVGSASWQVAPRTASNQPNQIITGLDSLKSYEYRVTPITSLGHAPAVLLDFTIDTPKVLDEVAIPALGAYGLRKLRQDYFGPAIAVRRNKDQAIRDIGFTPSGDLDVASLLGFVGLGGGFVDTWYDQSGNFRNLRQTQPNLQPRIVQNGQMERTSQGQPGVRFLGISNQEVLSFLGNSSFITNEFSVNLVFTEVARTNQIAWQLNRSSDPGNRVQVHLPWGDGNIYFDVGGFSGAARISSPINRAIGTTNQYTFANSILSNQKYLTVNGATRVTGTGTAAQGRQIQLGANDNLPMSGIFSEWILFGSALSATQRNTVEQNQSTYFQLVPTTLTSGVSNLQAKPGFESVLLSWTPPSANVLDYDISFRRADDTTWYLLVKVPSGQPFFWVKGLPGGVSFELRVAPKNSMGVGPSQRIFATTLRTGGVVNRLVQAKPIRLFSLRRVRDEYTGFAVRIRRESDNQTADIPFLANGELDEVTLANFVGTSNGYVDTWYDQSSMAQHAIQTTPNRQPLLVNSGQIFKVNNKPSLLFPEGRLVQLEFPIQMGLLSYSTSLVQQTTVENSGTGGLMLVHSNTSAYDFVGTKAGGALEVTRNLSSTEQKVSSVAHFGLPTVFSAHFEVSGRAVGHQNMLRVGTLTLPTQTQTTQVGKIGGLDASWAGSIAECLLFEESLHYMEANALEANQYAYFEIGKKVYTPQYLLDSTTIQGKQYSVTNTFQSPNFWISWGHGVGPDPKNASTQEWPTFDPMESMIMSERVYRGFKEKTGFLIDSAGTKMGQWKVPVVLCGSYGFNQGMCSAFAAGNGVNWDGVIGGFLVYPSGTLGEGLFAHEFVHSLQFQARNDKLLKCPTVGFSVGHIWESQANYLRSVLYPEMCTPYGVDFYHTLAPEPHWNSAYQGEVIFYALEADGGVDRTSSVWFNNCEGQTLFDTYKVLSQKTQDELSDFVWRNYAAASVGLDFERNGAFMRTYRSQYQNQDIRIRMRMWDILSPLDTLIQRYKIPDELAPEDHAFNMIRVIPKNRTEPIQVEFKGKREVNTQAGWRYGWVTLGSDGLAKRYIGPFRDSVGVISVMLASEETELFLVVSGAPRDKTYISSNQTTGKGKNSKFNYPYELVFDNAWPEGHQPATQFRAHLRSGGQIHPNGGGYIRNSQVDPTVFIGPNCYVVNSTVRGNVRIEGTAYVQNATVSGEVRIQDNAFINGGTLTENATISGNAQVTNCQVSGFAQVGDLVEISNHTLGGTIRVMGDVWTSATSACQSGHYATLTNYFSNNPLPCDNRQDTLTANLAKPNYRYYGENIRLALEKQQLKAILNLESLAKFRLDGGTSLSNRASPPQSQPQIVFQENAWSVWTGTQWKNIPDFPTSPFGPVITLTQAEAGRVVFLNDRLWGWNGTTWRRLVSSQDSEAATPAQILVQRSPRISVLGAFQTNQPNQLKLVDPGQITTSHGTLQYHYQWQQNEVDIPGATQTTLELTADKATCGVPYRLKIRMSTPYDQKEVLTNTIQFACQTPQTQTASTIQPILDIQNYGALTVALGTVDAGGGTVEVSFQWKRNGLPIEGQNQRMYVPMSTDLNQTISCEITWQNSVGSLQQTIQSPTFPFTPRLIQNLSMWLDGSNPITLQLEENTSRVMKWTDLSPIKNEVIQNTAIARPTWNANGLGVGLPSLYFDGINDRFVVNSNLLNTNPLAIFSVTNFQGTGGFSLISNDKPYFFGKAIGLLANNRAGFMMNNRIIEGPNQSWLPNQNTLVSAVYSSQNSELYIQGNQIISAGSRENMSSLDAENVILIGSGQVSGGYNPSKHISEIVLVSEDLTPSNTLLRQKIEGYLAWKWKLQDTLPNAHPFKNTPP